MIKLEHISRIYRLGQVQVNALIDVNLEIQEGEFIAITGPSGSGKSTLLHILGLLDRPTEGSYFFEGRDVSILTDDERTELRSHAIGFVFQQFSLLARTTAEHNVMLPLMYSGGSRGAQRARELLVSVGLSDRLHHFPNQLSGGQQQRVAIARSLVNKPKLVLADEPTGNLDSSAREEILAIFRKLHETGFTVVIVTHEEEISRSADRIIRFRDGRIVEDKMVRSVLSPPRKRGPSPLDSRFRRTDRSVPEDQAADRRSVNRRGNDKSEPPAFVGINLNEFQEHFKQALAMLRANRMRSFLSMLGVLIGVACLITMLSIGEGAQAEITKELSSLGSNLLVVRPGPENVRGAVRSMLTDIMRFTLDDLEAIRSGVPGIKRFSGYINKYCRITHKNKNWRTEVAGVSPEYIEMRDLTPTIGRSFTKEEDLKRERVILLGPAVKSEVFGNEDALDKTVRVDRLDFKVVGILAEKGSDAFRDRDDMALVPLRTAMTRITGSRYIDNIQVEAETTESTFQVSEDIKETLKRRHRSAPKKQDYEPFHIRNMADIQKALSESTKIFSMLLGSVAAVSLLVGGIGIMNVMLVSVTERTREIGIRKAVGARDRDVLSQFLVESTVLSITGGLAGILLGSFFSWAVAKAAEWPAVISINSIVTGFLFSAVLGVGFGVWPAYRASRLNPIDALRYE